jgi:alpha-galactosidase
MGFVGPATGFLALLDFFHYEIECCEVALRLWLWRPGCLTRPDRAFGKPGSDAEIAAHIGRQVKMIGKTTRRSFVQKGAVALSAMTAPIGIRSERPNESSSSHATTFLEIVRVPDSITAYRGFRGAVPEDGLQLRHSGELWSNADIVVETNVADDSLHLALTAPAAPVALIRFFWQAAVRQDLLVLGDAWERSYGELGWRNLIPERVMPWYFATFDHTACHAYGVKTDARALCFWQLDSQGVTLWLNVTNGGGGVELGKRRLEMATVVTHRSADDRGAVQAIKELCRKMCARTMRPIQQVYGANDWCYSYGHSTSDSIMRDTEFIVELSPPGAVRPFSVIDGGWQNATTPAWPDMAKLASEIKQRTARPGIWIRPLEAPAATPARLLLPDARFGEKKDRALEHAYDPTIPDTRTLIRSKVREVVDWGYELVKHDFSTYDLLGQWGFEMGPQPTLPGWSLFDRTRTNAEVIADLYALIREEAGPNALLDGCNTIGHLGQGIFDLQRTGDDTSGRQWERTRRMGVNTLTFRLPQHGTFFIQDADMVGITEAVPWECNRQWLDLLARSGAATFVAPGPMARGPEQRSALRDAFAIVAAGGLGAVPEDWMEKSVAHHWRGSSPNGARWSYNWNGPGGEMPFLGS